MKSLSSDWIFSGKTGQVQIFTFYFYTFTHKSQSVHMIMSQGSTTQDIVIQFLE